MNVEQLIEHIQNATLASERHDPIYPFQEEGEEMIKYLERQILLSRKKRYNDELVRLANFGYHIKGKKLISLGTITTRELKIADFLARVFPNGTQPIWHLEEITPYDISGKKQVTLNKVMEKIEYWNLTRQLSNKYGPALDLVDDSEIPEDPIQEGDWSTDTFQQWLDNWDMELEGMDVPDDTGAEHQEQGHNEGSTSESTRKRTREDDDVDDYGEGSHKRQATD
jgi:hypothetical protein